MGHSCILENTNAPTTADPRAESTRHGRIMLAGQLVIIIIALDWRGRGGVVPPPQRLCLRGAPSDEARLRFCGHTHTHTNTATLVSYFVPIFDGTLCDYLTGTSLGRKTA